MWDYMKLLYAVRWVVKFHMCSQNVYKYFFSCLSDSKMAYPPPRPQGTAPYEFMNDLLDGYADKHFALPACSMLTKKENGFNLCIQSDRAATDSTPLEKSRMYFSRSGKRCIPSDSGSLGLMAQVMLRDYPHLDPHKVTHPVYGHATALYGEFYVVRTDEEMAARASSYSGDELADLAALFHFKKGLLAHRKFGFKIFWVAFEQDKPSVFSSPLELTWGDRLRLCQLAFGPGSTVHVFFESGKKDLDYDGAVNFFCFGEGFVFFNEGKFYKHKPVRPVDMLLVAVGLTDVCAGAKLQKTYRLPTHFFWGVYEPSLSNTDQKTFVVPFVENLEYLFDAKRPEQGKVRLLADKVGHAAGSYSYDSRPSCFSRAYLERLKLIGHGPFVDALVCQKKQVQLKDSRRLLIASNRSSVFTGMDIKFPPVPARGVVTANEFWMTGDQVCAAGVHFQGGTFVASKDFGPDVLRSIVQDNTEPVSAACLVKIATALSLDLRDHAREVYGGGLTDPVFGDRLLYWRHEESEDYETPLDSDQERYDRLDDEHFSDFSDGELEVAKARMPSVHARRMKAEREYTRVVKHRFNHDGRVT